MKKSKGIFTFIVVLITYIIVHIIYKLTGFYYNFGDGILNSKLVIDLALWGVVYFIVYILSKKLSSVIIK
ncbi:hypothetical protein [Clostridium estertheticum]|uniref:CPBP family intramembrane metalloprotease n=1 Tax=Clostridium estertheticum TaxID=238834 RepID=A0A5N7IXQ5_9CLOT|nr:hypothetical protein [Clostridium estertheticum]MBU3071963.1 hypothetical protein [Clostridium estertheticum]MBU3162055.1 hypothetical protein [Clostridium estertheticum]MBU3171110.1 hypothetical protein [Clostridium estertheticum]MPQ30581.1 hypothetical protein [Clostridium estertheticum]MPQ61257.1 hypothetical protein [Clostridium estertheticum]